jgi:AraC-like DNA-binding protein
MDACEHRRQRRAVGISQGDEPVSATRHSIATAGEGATDSGADRQVFRLSTAGLPEAQRLQTVRESLWRRFHGIELDHRDEAPLQSEVALFGLPGAHLQRGYMTAAHLQRQASDDGHLILTCYLDGRVQASSRRAEILADAGDGVLFSSMHAHRFDVPASRFFCVGAPLAHLAPLLRQPFTPGLQQLRQGRALRMLRSYVLWLAQDGDALAAPELAQAAARHIHDLLALAIGASRETEHEVLPRSLGLARLREAKAYIEAHLLHGRLGVAEVAAHLGVTPRYVQQLFERDGTSFSRYVLEQRLLCAYRLLRNPCVRQRDITQVALDAGFGDLSYFNRRFRERFGTTPSAVRATAPDA